MKTRIISAILAGAMLLSLTACDFGNLIGGSDNSTERDAQDAARNLEAEQRQREADEAARGITTAAPDAPTPPPSIKVGENIDLGDINWRVLAVEDGKALLLSEYVLEQRSFHNVATENVTWETSEVRAYLNGEFYERFDDEVKARIIETTIEDPAYDFLSGREGNDTGDKIFLLCAGEVMKYFGGGVLCLKTPSPRVGRDADRNARIWFLRSTSTTGGCTIIMGTGQFAPGPRNTNYWIRPAMWVSL